MDADDDMYICPREFGGDTCWWGSLTAEVLYDIIGHDMHVECLDYDDENGEDQGGQDDEGVGENHAEERRSYSFVSVVARE